MLRNLAWQATDTLTRAQFVMFHALADQINLTQDDRRRALDLDDLNWTAWSDFLHDGPLPAEPPLSDLLRRVGQTSFNLSIMADRIVTRSAV